jgi:hypothetical protein
MLVSEVPTPAWPGPCSFRHLLLQNGVLITGSLVGDEMNTRGLRGQSTPPHDFDLFYHSICMLTTSLFDFVGVELPALIW